MYIVTKNKKILTPLPFYTLDYWSFKGIETEIKDWFKCDLNEKEKNYKLKSYEDYFLVNSIFGDKDYISDDNHLWLEIEHMFGVHDSYINKIGLFNINEEQCLVAEIKTDDDDKYIHTSYWKIKRDEDNEFETTKIELDHDFNRFMLNNFDPR